MKQLPLTPDEIEMSIETDIVDEVCSLTIYLNERLTEAFQNGKTGIHYDIRQISLPVVKQITKELQKAGWSVIEQKDGGSDPRGTITPYHRLYISKREMNVRDYYDK